MLFNKFTNISLFNNYYYLYLTGDKLSLILKPLSVSLSLENINLHFLKSLSLTTPSSFEYDDKEDAAFCQIANSCLNSIY